MAYAIAKVAHDAEIMNRNVNFDSIWRAQNISKAMTKALAIVAEDVTGVLTNPPGGQKNVTEWAKQQACWNRVQELSIDWPRDWLDELQSKDESHTAARQAVREQKVFNGIEAQTAVVNATGATWKLIKEWAVDNRLLSERELEILDVAAAMPHKLPSEKQSIVIMKAFAKLRSEGCPHGANID